MTGPAATPAHSSPRRHSWLTSTTQRSRDGRRHVMLLLLGTSPVRPCPTDAEHPPRGSSPAPRSGRSMPGADVPNEDGRCRTDEQSLASHAAFQPVGSSLSRSSRSSRSATRSGPGLVFHRRPWRRKRRSADRTEHRDSGNDTVRLWFGRPDALVSVNLASNDLVVPPCAGSVEPLAPVIDERSPRDWRVTTTMIRRDQDGLTVSVAWDDPAQESPGLGSSRSSPRQREYADTFGR